MRFIPWFLLLLAGYQSKNDWKRFNITGQAQGTTYSISYYATDSVVTKWMIDSVLMSLDSSLSLYKPYSGINRFNESATGTNLDEHLLTVVKKSIEVNKTTNGLFDITVQPLVQAWGFGVTKINVVPGETVIKQIINCVDSKLLQLKGNRLMKKKSCVKIDLNGIAQGYSVDVLATYFEANGIQNYLIELGGELRVKGRKQPSEERMKVGIESAMEDAFENYPFQKVLELDGGAITTSGSYRKYYESKGKKITHIINPKTGYPQNNELISVTVYAEDAITADAYDNALMLMGLKKALAFVERRKDMAAFFVYKNIGGIIADTASSRFIKLINP